MASAPQGNVVALSARRRAALNSGAAEHPKLEPGRLGYQVAAAALLAGLAVLAWMVFGQIIRDTRSLEPCGRAFPLADGGVVVVECVEPDDAVRGSEVWR